MPTSPSRPFALGALFALAAFGCGAQVKVTPIADRTYAVECRQALANCLVRVEELCSAHGYDVLTATERRETSGASPVEAEYVKASATVRCRLAVPVFGPDTNPPPPPIASAGPSTPSPSSLPAASPPSSASAPSAAPATSSAPATSTAAGFAPLPPPSSSAPTPAP